MRTRTARAVVGVRLSLDDPFEYGALGDDLPVAALLWELNCTTEEIAHALDRHESVIANNIEAIREFSRPRYREAAE